MAVDARVLKIEHIPRKAWCRAAYFEHKVARQVSTGSGSAFLIDEKGKPPRHFVELELGYGADQRPCSDDQRPCTLDYTLQNLEEINQRNRITFLQREGEGIETEASRERRRLTGAKASQKLRQKLRQAGGAASGTAISAKGWTPMQNPNSSAQRRVAFTVVHFLRGAWEVKLPRPVGHALVAFFRSIRAAGELPAAAAA